MQLCVQGLETMPEGPPGRVSLTSLDILSNLPLERIRNPLTWIKIVPPGVP